MIRFASPEEIGRFVAVLLSEHGAGGGFMTGSDVVIDGGEFGVNQAHSKPGTVMAELM